MPNLRSNMFAAHATNGEIALVALQAARTAPALFKPEWEETRVRSPYWHGMLCADTVGEISDRMREVLGDNYFTLVTGNSYSETSEAFTSIDVYPSQYLTKPITSDDTVWISWLLPRLAMGVRSSARTQAEARDGRPHEYVHFNFQPDRVVIDHYAPAGYRLLWAFAVERHDREDA